jgi:hypothetical protein
MATGTIPQLFELIAIENTKISLQEFYAFIKILEQIGLARVVGKSKPKEAGRHGKIYEIPNFDIKITLFAKNG